MKLKSLRITPQVASFPERAPVEIVAKPLATITYAVIVAGSVIQSFQCKETKQIWDGKGSRRLPTSIQRTALRKLLQLHSAETLNDMRTPPANRLEALKGKRAGQFSIRINDQWRICFTWQHGEAHAVEIVDYH